MRKVELLPTRDCEAGYGPGLFSLRLIGSAMFGATFYLATRLGLP